MRRSRCNDVTLFTFNFDCGPEPRFSLSRSGFTAACLGTSMASRWNVSWVAYRCARRPRNYRYRMDSFAPGGRIHRRRGMVRSSVSAGDWIAQNDGARRDGKLQISQKTCSGSSNFASERRVARAGSIISPFGISSEPRRCFRLSPHRARNDTARSTRCAPGGQPIGQIGWVAQLLLFACFRPRLDLY